MFYTTVFRNCGCTYYIHTYVIACFFQTSVFIYASVWNEKCVSIPITTATIKTLQLFCSKTLISKSLINYETVIKISLVHFISLI